MNLYSGFCNICYKTDDGCLKNISEENLKNLKDSLITFVGHAHITNHNIINLCQLCCEELTRSNKFREMCFTNLMQLRQNVFDMKSKLEDICNICYKTDDGYLNNTEERMKNLKDTLITFVGHGDSINDKIINLCQSCCEELTRSNKFREMCYTHLIQLRQSVIDMKSKLELEDDSYAVQNKLQIFVHQEVLRRYTLEKSNCPVLIRTEYEKSCADLSKNDSVFNRQIINLQSQSNDCQFVGDYGDVSVINTATESYETQVAFKNEGFTFVKCELESDEDFEYAKEEFHVKKEVVLSDPEDFESKSGRHFNEGMIKSGIEYMKETLYVKQEKSSEDLDLETTKEEFGDGQNVPIEFVNVSSIVKTEDCEENVQDDMNLSSRGKNKSPAAVINLRERSNGSCPTAISPGVHKQIYPDAKPHTCSLCSKSFAVPYSLTKHKCIPSGARPYKCTVCNKAFTQLGNLVAHKRIHTGERPYKCNLCNKTFTQSPHLTKHIRTHRGNRPYNCTVCNKNFTASFSLTEHERIHNGLKPYKCTVCDKDFAQLSALTKHERTHNGDRPYQCNVCTKAFTVSSNLIRHKRIHSGERPYKCTGCDKAFVTASHLTIHERIHTGDRPYKCKFCNKAFMQIGSLTSHERIHRGDRPYKCTVCSKAYTCSSHLAKHKQSHREDSF